MKTVVAILLMTSVANAQYYGVAPIDLDAYTVTPTKVKPKKLKRYLNVFRDKKDWSHPVNSAWGPKESLIRHLMGEYGHRVHGGKFKRETLEKLSYAKLKKLHSNDHDKKPFFYSYDGFPMKTEKVTPVKSPSSACPT